MDLPFNVTTRGLPDLTRPGMWLYPETHYQFHVSALVVHTYQFYDIALYFPHVIEEKDGHGIMYSAFPEQEAWLRSWVGSRPSYLGAGSLRMSLAALDDWLALLVSSADTILAPGERLFTDEYHDYTRLPR